MGSYPVAACRGKTRIFGGIPEFNFDLGLSTFTPHMAKRAGALFAATPIIQGKFDGTGTGDIVSCSRGSQISGHFYENLDGYQWYGFAFLRFEIDSADGSGDAIIFYASANHYFLYDYDNDRFELMVGGQTMTVNHTAVAGTTIALCFGGSSVWALDGTNYARVSINDVHTYGISTQPTASSPDSTIYIGSNNGNNAVNTIVEGLVIIRGIPFDGTYGIDLGFGDVIADHYNAGSFADVAETIGSWGSTLSFPTNSTVEELTTGIGEAWSHPHNSAILTDTYCQTTYGSSAWSTKGTPSSGPGDISSSEQLFGVGGYEFTIDAGGEGIEQSLSGLVAGSNYVIRLLAHEDDTNDIRLLVNDDTNGAAITTFLFGSGSDRDTPGVALITWELPTVARNGVASDCTAITISVEGTNSGQTVYIHQVEVQHNLIDNPSMETGSGNPWIPDGWINNSLDPGESNQDLVDFHSGNSSAHLTPSANGEGFRQQFSATAGKFFSVGCWAKRISGSINYVDIAQNIFRQSTLNSFILFNVGNPAWTLKNVVGRGNGTSFYILFAQSGGEYKLDDTFVFQLDDVSLTVVTPANEVNSTEQSGLRVDGLDELSQPTAKNTNVAGSYNARYISRHSIADVADFGKTTEYLFTHYEDANNYIFARRENNLIRLSYNANGGGLQTATYNATGTWDSDVEKLIRVEYDSSSARLLIDGVLQITIAGAVAFAANWTQPVDWGTDENQQNQFDGIVKAP